MFFSMPLCAFSVAFRVINISQSYTEKSQTYTEITLVSTVSYYSYSAKARIVTYQLSGLRFSSVPLSVFSVALSVLNISQSYIKKSQSYTEIILVSTVSYYSYSAKARIVIY